MDDRTHVVSDEEFVAAVVDRANDLACEGERSPRLLRGWASLCGLSEPGAPGPVFWEGFVLGGAGGSQSCRGSGVGRGAHVASPAARENLNLQA